MVVLAMAYRGEAEAVTGGEFRVPVQKLLEQVIENRGIAPVHGIDQSGFCDRLHRKMVQSGLVGQKTVAYFTQGVHAGNLRVQTGEELPPGGEMLAIAVGAVHLNGFFKTMPRYELERLRKDSIVLPWFRAMARKLCGLAIP